MRTGEGPVELALSDVTTDQFLEALHYNRCRRNGTGVMQITDYGLFGSGTITEDGGTVDWDRGQLKILARTPANWSVQSFSTCPGTSSGHAAFLGFTNLIVRLFMFLHREDEAAVGWCLGYSGLW